MTSTWVAFGCGLFFGAMGGMAVMCLVAINRAND
jgi:hypothetical protein